MMRNPVPKIQGFKSFQKLSQGFRLPSPFQPHPEEFLGHGPTGAPLLSQKLVSMLPRMCGKEKF